MSKNFFRNSKSELIICSIIYLIDFYKTEEKQKEKLDKNFEIHGNMRYNGLRYQ